MNCPRTILLAMLLGSVIPAHTEESVARIWNEQNLAAIRTAFPDPPVHARNLFHVSTAIWDAWAAYDPDAIGYVHNEDISSVNIDLDRRKAISYAAYRVLVDRYFIHKHPITPQQNADAVLAELNARMAELGFPASYTSLVGSDPAAVGNRVAAAVLAFAATDGSRENTGYDDPSYSPVNRPLVIDLSGNTMSDPNRWQPLAFSHFVNTQNGIVIPRNIQTFVGAHWGNVRPFALHHENSPSLYFDPGPPPLIDDQAFKLNNLEIIRFSSWLDPSDESEEAMIDCSPAMIGNNTLGFNDGHGHQQNPATGAAYLPNPVHRADFGRVVAEFWADGPSSETPPGHWNTIANDVSDSPDLIRRIGGSGPILDRLEWDVKLYFSLNASVHDVAVAVWGCKRFYDYVRPISSVRYMASLGQSTDPSGPSYHPNGLPLEAGLCEVITLESSVIGQRHEHLSDSLGKIAIFAWGGEPEDPENQFTGTKWILAEDWLPYQRDTFVTPAFAGYVSGHSAFSRAAAEVLTQMTGDPFFPGGMGSYTATAGSLEFEAGPAEPVDLQWATYYDAADQAGISRIYGGIHVAPDDGPGRIIGSKCGEAAWSLATQYYDGSIIDQPFSLSVERLENGNLSLTWPQSRGLFYALLCSPDLQGYCDVIPFTRSEDDLGNAIIPVSEMTEPSLFFRVVNSTTGK